MDFYIWEFVEQVTESIPTLSFGALIVTGREYFMSTSSNWQAERYPSRPGDIL